MAKISSELRETIIQLHLSGHKANFIAQMLPKTVERSSIFRIIKSFKTTGSTKDKKRQRKSQFTEEMSQFVEAVYATNRYGNIIYMGICKVFGNSNLWNFI